MADQTDKGRAEAFPAKYRDESDGTFSKAGTANLRGWDTTDLQWYKLPVDHATGQLLVQTTLAAGSATVGKVDQGAAGAAAWKVTDAALADGTQRVGGTVAVTGTFWQATQPVSGTFWQATQPVSGTVTANAGTGTFGVSLAAETTKVIGVTRSADGSGNLLTSTSGALDINIKSGNPTTMPVTNTGTFAVQATLAAETTKVIGTVNQGTSPWAVSLAAETTKVIGVTRSADGSGNLLTSTSSALDINIKSGNLTTLPVTNAGTFAVQAAQSGTWTVQPGNTPNTTAWFVGGGVADAVATSGNPVPAGAVYESAPPIYTAGQRTTLHTGTRGALRVELYNPDSTTAFGGTTSSDALTNAGTLLYSMSRGLTYNETTWDRFRGNTNTTTGDTGSKTTGNFTGATQTNYNARGAVITALIGTVTGAVTTFQTFLQWSYDGGTTWLGLTPLGANLTTIASGNTVTWIVYPTNTSQAAGSAPAVLAPNGGPTQLNSVNAALPRTWRWCMSLTVATSLVLTSVNVNYIL